MSTAPRKRELVHQIRLRGLFRPRISALPGGNSWSFGCKPPGAGRESWTSGRVLWTSASTPGGAEKTLEPLPRKALRAFRLHSAASSARPLRPSCPQPPEKRELVHKTRPRGPFRPRNSAPRAGISWGFGRKLPEFRAHPLDFRTHPGGARKTPEPLPLKARRAFSARKVHAKVQAEKTRFWTFVRRKWTSAHKGLDFCTQKLGLLHTKAWTFVRRTLDFCTQDLGLWYTRPWTFVFIKTLEAA